MAEIAAVVIWTYARLIALLEDNTAALERAILTINARQTADERATFASRHENGRGWNQRDASFGGSLAEWIERGIKPRSQGGFGHAPGSCLTTRQRDGALKMVRKYWRQLLEEVALKGGKVDYKAPTPRKGAKTTREREEADAIASVMGHQDRGLTAAQEEGYDHRPPNGWFSREEADQPEF